MFGRMKACAGLAKVKLRGRRMVEAAFALGPAVDNLVRLPKRPAPA